MTMAGFIQAGSSRSRGICEKLWPLPMTCDVSKVHKGVQWRPFGGVGW